jgi:hypothetical protein
MALVQKGVNIKVVARLLGHENIATTETHYARISTEVIRKTMKSTVSLPALCISIRLLIVALHIPVSLDTWYTLFVPSSTTLRTMELLNPFEYFIGFCFPPSENYCDSYCSPTSARFSPSLTRSERMVATRSRP